MTFPIIPASTVSGSYQISRSLRFRSSASAYLSRTPSAGNQQTWTWSGWVKRGLLSGSTSYGLFQGKSTSTDLTAVTFSNDTIVIQDFSNASGYNLIWQTSAVFRDASAWYNIVLAYDTTQASSANAVKLYINGVQQTLTFTAAVGSYLQNRNSFVNATNPQEIGNYYISSYFDGYLAEVNFIDGQALTPSSFGAFDTNGVWQPAKYTDSYGTNGFYLPFSDTASTTQNFLTYSEQFDNAAWSKTNVTVTANSVAAPNGATVADTVTENTATDEHYTEQIYTKSASSITYTYSAYVKSNGRNYCIIVRGPSSANNATIAVDTSTGAIILSATASGTFSSASGAVQSVGNGWYRVSITFTSDTGTTLYIRNYGYNGASAYTGNGSSGFYIWGAQLQASSSVGPYIVTSATAQTTATTNLGADYQISGGGWNNWLSNNISVTAGTTYDSMIDSPTNYADGGNGRGNYCTWNPVYKNATVAATDGNLSANSGATSSTHRMIFGTLGFTTASYFEITTSGGSTTMVSIVGAGQATTGTADGVYVGSFSKSFGLGYATNAASWYATGATNANGAATNLVDGTWGFAVDPANGKAWVRNTSGSWIGGGDPAAGTLPTFTWTSDGLPWFPVMSFYNIATTFVGILNAGQRSYAFTAPSGFSALNTQNLPTPTIAAGNKYFGVVTYPGTGSTQTISGFSLNSAIDFLWIKERSTNVGGTGNHRLYDVLRTFSSWLATNTTGSETASGTVGNPTSTKVDVGTDNDVNDSGGSYVAWAWAAGGTGVSNTSGSITSTVSANTSAGFSVVTYTGTGANATVGHGLGVAPSMILIKDRDSGTNGGAVYHESIGATKYLKLFQTTTGTDAAAIDNTVWNGGSPTFNSSVFSIGTNARTNSTDRYVALCWTPIAGYSAFGSYTGNGLPDGPFVYTGFRPRWIMVKRTDTAGTNWNLYDTSRSPYNVIDTALNPNTSDAESASTTNLFDILASGVKVRGTSIATNASGGTYIYAAFCELPFKTSRAR